MLSHDIWALSKRSIMKRRDTITDVLCDLYDLRTAARLRGFGKLPKDNEGTETTIMDCIDNCIEQVESLTDG